MMAFLASVWWFALGAFVIFITDSDEVAVRRWCFQGAGLLLMVLGIFVAKGVS